MRQKQTTAIVENTPTYPATLSTMTCNMDNLNLCHHLKLDLVDLRKEHGIVEIILTIKSQTVLFFRTNTKFIVTKISPVSWAKLLDAYLFYTSTNVEFLFWLKQINVSKIIIKF